MCEVIVVNPVFKTLGVIAQCYSHFITAKVSCANLLVRWLNGMAPPLIPQKLHVQTSW
jgi:hypothetical protein